MAGKKHTHKYHKINVAGTLVWACALPECSHYMPDHLKHMIPGKMSICWSCGESFALDERALRMTQPICINCAFPTDGVMDALLNNDRRNPFGTGNVGNAIDDVKDPDDL